MANVVIHGLPQLQQRMRALSKDMEKKAARYAARYAASVVRDAAVRNAERIDDPATAENIAKNIAVRFASRMSKRGDVAFRIGVLGGARQYGDTKENRRKNRVGKTYKTGGDKANPGGDTWYWRLVHFGTRHSRAQPFLQQAGASSAEPATNEFVNRMNSWLDRYFKTLGK